MNSDCVQQLFVLSNFPSIHASDFKLRRVKLSQTPARKYIERFAGRSFPGLLGWSPPRII